MPERSLNTQRSLKLVYRVLTDDEKHVRRQKRVETSVCKECFGNAKEYESHDRREGQRLRLMRTSRVWIEQIDLIEEKSALLPRYSR